MAKLFKSALYIFLLSLVYAMLRYHVFKGVPWEQFPIYILNKVFALSAFILFAFSFSICPIQKLGWINLLKSEECKYLGRMGMIFLLFHLIMSLVILNPAYFEKFYDFEGNLNLIGNLSLFLGIAGLIFIILYHSMFRESIQNAKKAYSLLQTNRFVMLGLLTMCGHVFVMGIKSWISPNEWPGFMPPISLISFVVLFFTLSLNIFVVRK